MKWKLLQEEAPRTFAIVLDKGDEAVEALTAFIRQHRVTAARFTGLGAFGALTLGFFDWQAKQYRKIPIAEQVEVLALVGDVALGEDGQPSLHPHIVVGKSDGTAHGGHLLEGHVRPTLEVTLSETPAHLQRRVDPESRLPLIRLD